MRVPEPGAQLRVAGEGTRCPLFGTGKPFLRVRQCDRYAPTAKAIVRAVTGL